MIHKSKYKILIKDQNIKMSGLTPSTSSKRNPEESVKVIRRRYDELVAIVTKIRNEFDALRDYDTRVKAVDLLNSASYHLREAEKVVLCSYFEQTIFYGNTLKDTLHNMAYAAAYSQEARRYIRGFMDPLDAAVKETAAACHCAWWLHQKADDALSVAKENAEIAAANLDTVLKSFGPDSYAAEVYAKDVARMADAVAKTTSELTAATVAETEAHAAYQAAKAARDVYKTETIVAAWAASRAAEGI